MPVTRTYVFNMVGSEVSLVLDFACIVTGIFGCMDPAVQAIFSTQPGAANSSSGQDITREHIASLNTLNGPTNGGQQVGVSGLKYPLKKGQRLYCDTNGVAYLNIILEASS